MSNLNTLRSNRRGVVLIYAAVLLMILVALVAFAVDIGRAHLVKTQLQATADAAARAAAWRLPYQVLNTKSNVVDSTGVTYTAADVAARNTADGTSVVVDPSLDVELGTWSLKTRTFTKATSNDLLMQANAVHVTVRRTASRGTGVQRDFAPAIGGSQSKDIAAEAYAMV